MPCRIINSDVMEALASMGDRSCHCVVTSPPYWGLRDYGTASWEGGDPNCQHRVGGQAQDTKAPGAITTGQRPGVDSSRCKVCGARRIDRQLGLEPTLDCLGWATGQRCGVCYICRMTAVFAEVWRVLRDDGTCWVNMGDSYNAYNGLAGPSSSISAGASTTERPSLASGYGLRTRSLKPKDLCMVPARLALSLQAAGWYLRSAVVWAKGVSFCPNYSGSVMPESCRDRPTSAYEMVYLLTKSPTYYYDYVAVQEQGIYPAGTKAAKGGDKRSSEPGVNSRPPEYAEYSGKRNLRNVWCIPTAKYPAAHFATYSTELVRPMVRAGTSEKGCCPTCGAPWVMVVERTAMVVAEGPKGRVTRTQCSGTVIEPPTCRTTGWNPTCTNGLDPVPCTVLDPFAGSGTTLAVAVEEGRDAVLIELNPEYVKLIEQRLSRVVRQEVLI